MLYSYGITRRGKGNYFLKLPTPKIKDCFWFFLNSAKTIEIMPILIPFGIVHY